MLWLILAILLQECILLPDLVLLLFHQEDLLLIIWHIDDLELLVALRCVIL